MIPWIRFEWSTAGVADPVVDVAPLILRPATKEDAAVVGRVISSSIAMDSSWSDVTKTLAEKLLAGVHAAFDSVEPPCVVLVHGARVIGASVLDPEPASENHLVTGPCVLHEYRNRGFGTSLLHASLEFLKKNGVSTARGCTRSNSVSARFVYPKFGGVSAPLEADPLTAKAE